MNSDERIACLRERCLERKNRVCMERAPWVARALQSSEDLPWQVRMGLRTREILANVRLAVDDSEILMGRMDPNHVPFSEEEVERANEYLGQFQWPSGQTGHCELDYSRLFRLGVNGIREDLRNRMEKADDRTADMYQSFIYALDGLTALVENAAHTADDAMADVPDWRKAELQEMADSCRRIAHAAPQSFRDAIQLVWFVIFSVMHGEQVSLVGPGHLDRTLFRFYEMDLAQGALTRDQVLLLIESLYLLINEYIPDGLAMPVMVGGRDADGHDVTNDLSYFCLEALRRTKLIYPTVGICWHEGTPRNIVDLAIDLIGKGCSTPAFFGDDVIQKGLKNLSVPVEQACNYINSTCVEITPCGASNVWVASPYYNICGLLLEEITAQAEAPVSTFKEFVMRYRKRLVSAIERGVRSQNDMRRGRQKYGGKPLQSVFTRDCIECGRDIDDGGAVYNWVECSFVGLANLADSLYVLREEVYNRKLLTLTELKTVLNADFEGYEDIRLRFMNAYPKYGQDNPDVDNLVGETVQFMVEKCARFTMEPDGSPYVPGGFVWVVHERFGCETGATPDGRKAGFPFADGCGPAQGRESKGPTAAILSTTSWDHSPMIGGLAYNMKFNASLFDSKENFNRLRDLVLTFLQQGGFEIQINVVDHKTLKKARENPEEYRDLVVRIGGYCDYFTRLSPEMQDEIIMRTEFDFV